MEKEKTPEVSFTQEVQQVRDRLRETKERFLKRYRWRDSVRPKSMQGQRTYVPEKVTGSMDEVKQAAETALLKFIVGTLFDSSTTVPLSIQSLHKKLLNTGTSDKYEKALSTLGLSNPEAIIVKLSPPEGRCLDVSLLSVNDHTKTYITKIDRHALSSVSGIDLPGGKPLHAHPPPPPPAHSGPPTSGPPSSALLPGPGMMLHPGMLPGPHPPLGMGDTFSIPPMAFGPGAMMPRPMGVLPPGLPTLLGSLPGTGPVGPGSGMMGMMGMGGMMGPPPGPAPPPGPPPSGLGETGSGQPGSSGKRGRETVEELDSLLGKQSVRERFKTERCGVEPFMPANMEQAFAMGIIQGPHRARGRIMRGHGSLYPP